MGTKSDLSLIAVGGNWEVLVSDRVVLTYDGAYVDVSFDGLPGWGFSEDDVFEGCPGEGHGYGGGADELVTLVLVCWKMKMKIRGTSCCCYD